jgi:hypothetical protein
MAAAQPLYAPTRPIHVRADRYFVEVATPNLWLELLRSLVEAEYRPRNLRDLFAHDLSSFPLDRSRNPDGYAVGLLPDHPTRTPRSKAASQSWTSWQRSGSAGRRAGPSRGLSRSKAYSMLTRLSTGWVFEEGARRRAIRGSTTGGTCLLAWHATSLADEGSADLWMVVGCSATRLRRHDRRSVLPHNSGRIPTRWPPDEVRT